MSPCGASSPVYTSSHPAVDTGQAWAMSCDQKAVPMMAVTGGQLPWQLPCFSCDHYSHMPYGVQRDPGTVFVTGPFYPKSLLPLTKEGFLRSSCRWPAFGESTLSLSQNQKATEKPLGLMSSPLPFLHRLPFQGKSFQELRLGQVESL